MNWPSHARGCDCEQGAHCSSPNFQLGVLRETRHVSDELVNAEDVLQVCELGEAVRQVTEHVLVDDLRVLAVERWVLCLSSDAARHEFVKSFQRVTELRSRLQQLLLQRFHFLHQIE